MYVGSEIECRAHSAALPYNTDSWKFHNLEDFGSYCYDEGYDAGYDCGYSIGADS